MIKAVIFDFFGVLYSDDYWNLVKSERGVEGVFSKLSQSVNLGEISWNEFVKEVAKKTGEDIKTVEHMYESERINPHLAAYIRHLRKHYKTALLTNASSEYIHPLLDRTGLDTIFDKIVISSEVGIIKPDSRIYRYTLEKLGVEPDEAVFIDDFPARVEGAKKTGMHAIVYTDFAQMKRELEELLKI